MFGKIFKKTQKKSEKVGILQEIFEIYIPTKVKILLILSILKAISKEFDPN